LSTNFDEIVGVLDGCGVLLTTVDYVLVI